MSIENIKPSCNFGDYVAPNHFSAEQFQAFEDMDIDKEFDMVAPVFIYFAADSSRRAAALTALKKLAKAKHPLMADTTPEAVIDQNFTPDFLETRYNALIFALAEDVIPGVESYIDEYGAFSFRNGSDGSLLMGDASGTFAFYEDAKSVRQRLKDAL